MDEHESITEGLRFMSEDLVSIADRIGAQMVELPRDADGNPIHLKDKQTDDPVDHPSHYCSGDIECIDAISSALGHDGLIAFCRGNAIKYLWRAGLKGDMGEDLRKAAWYCERAAKEVDE